MQLNLSIRSRLAQLEQAMANAASYEEWFEAASEHDLYSGAEDWRQDERTRYLHVESIKGHIYQLRTMREAGESWKLMSLLRESLFRYQGEFSHPELYGRALCGTKYLVSSFLDEVEACLLHLSNVHVEGLTEVRRLGEFKKAGKVYGRPALMLSGGASFGMFHLGVCKALLEQNLLPRTISGSSMGAIMGSLICSRTDEEIHDLFENLDTVNREALRFYRLSEIMENGGLLDQERLLSHIQANSGSITFHEALKKSKRILNITVSPTQKYQTPKLLNYLSAPDVLIEYAALASSAIPGVFNPVQLKARRGNRVVNWMTDERWCDGSVAHDLPAFQLTQMLNINHHITSQTNPHIIPFGAAAAPEHMLGRLVKMGQTISRTALAETLDIARAHAPGNITKHFLDKAHQVTNQVYFGDINITMPFKPSLYPSLLSDPTQAHLESLIEMGEQCTYSKIPRIRDRTRISRLFGNYIGVIKERVKAQKQP